VTYDLRADTSRTELITLSEIEPVAFFSYNP